MDEDRMAILLRGWRAGMSTPGDVAEMRKALPWSRIEASRPRCPRVAGSRSVEDQQRCLLPADHVLLGRIHQIGPDEGVPEPETDHWK